MPANFSKLRLRYTHAIEGQDDLVLVFDLSSLNFDINHATIGSSTPFTSELTFIMAIAESTSSGFKSLGELAKSLNQHFPGTPIGSPNTPGKKISDEDRVTQITNLLQGISAGDKFEGVFIGGGNSLTDLTGNIGLLFRDINAPDDEIKFIRNSSIQVLVTPTNPGESELFSLAWSVKIKFHATSPGLENGIVYYPEITNLTEPPASPPARAIVAIAGHTARQISFEDNTLAPFNQELKMNYELSYLPEQSSTPPGSSSSIGKATDELTDSLANLTSKLAANLTTTFKTQLRPPGQSFTEDVALWVMIKKGTDELSFSRYLKYMDTIFCGESNYSISGELKEKAGHLNTRRSSPFMNVDAYRAVKIATEAFVMVNCMVSRPFTSEEIEDLSKNVRLVNGVPDETELSNYFNRYKESVNGGGAAIPYLAVIRRKLSNEGIKVSSFEDAFERYLNPANSNGEELSCYGIISDKLTRPCFLELIWSYWHEESMMVQGLNAICRRFQNIRGPGKVDPLANLEIDPLRPLNNLMWGYIQDNQHLLSVRRRAYEYNHHYGITLKGEAARDLRFADPRSKFIEAFHTLLNLASRFFKQADDMTVQPDGFPILNGLRETHLILSEGAHNQYGDLPSTARAEMLMEQWLLARPEFREFLPTRIMVAYPEPWMDRVAALNQLMGHTKTSVLHFNYLAIFGEKILLSIRFGDWANPSNRADAAATWANFWRLEIQGYIHSYRAVTGVDLSADGVMAGQRVDAQQPSVHLFRRLAEQQNGNGKMSKTEAAAVVK
ncbi:MAG: hypothetical protein DYG98_18695 [Haliscomenobacteraceae bacterium CHB4]|nr:hypothetical protein [Saprospiraceae bacterium]MCE7925087.1 hypothetical protein [Haliscomenobacteraceae bacterium CHB4]